MVCLDRRRGDEGEWLVVDLGIHLQEMSRSFLDGESNMMHTFHWMPFGHLPPQLLLQ